MRSLVDVAVSVAYSSLIWLERNFLNVTVSYLGLVGIWWHRSEN